MSIKQKFSSCMDNLKQRFDCISGGNGKIYIIALLVIVLAGSIGSYMYFSHVNEQKYLVQYTEASHELATANERLTIDVSSSKLTKDQVENVKKELGLEKEALDNLAKSFSEGKPLEKYDKQHKDTISLLQKESALINNIILAVDKPLDSSIDAPLETMKDDIDGIKELCNAINVPNTTFVPTSDLASIVQPLNAFVTDQRRINKEKMDKLKAMQKFFQSMDDIIQKYDSAKGDMGTVMGASEDGAGIIWNDYFSAVNSAKYARTDLRKKLTEIVPPAGTEGLKSTFLGILDDAVSYCNMMQVAGNLQRNHYWSDGYIKENEAKRINERVKSNYESFINTYNSEKSRLTNVNNL